VTFQELSSELLELFGRGVGATLSEDRFNDLALRIFRYQCHANPVYGAFVRRRGVFPGKVARWEEIPTVPTQAFKSMALVAGDPGRVERVFRTSGTTRGREQRGEHHVLDLSLYRESLLPNFRAFLLPEDLSLPCLCLLPSPEEAPDSSLSFMLATVQEHTGCAGGGFFVRPSGEIQTGALRDAMLGAEEEARPVLLAGTAFAFVRLLEMLESEGWRARLSEGSRIMETGGYKGRSRPLSREELYVGLQERFGIPSSRIVNEYGMTELLSQFYEPVLVGEGAPELAHRYHRGPPWVRTRALDPRTLEPVPPGEVGILAHVDLANLGSAMAVLTEDLGQMVEGGFRLRGRAVGAEPRGCSLAMEDIVASAGEGL
jgi:hypothetical protein